MRRSVSLAENSLLIINHSQLCISYSIESSFMIVYNSSRIYDYLRRSSIPCKILCRLADAHCATCTIIHSSSCSDQPDPLVVATTAPLLLHSSRHVPGSFSLIWSYIFEILLPLRVFLNKQRQEQLGYQPGWRKQLWYLFKVKKMRSVLNKLYYNTECYNNIIY
jgi:hypothetical protein